MGQQHPPISVALTSCAASGGTTPTYEDLWYTTNGAATGPLCSGNDQVCRKRTRRNQTITTTYDAMNRVATKASQGLPTVTTAYNLRSEPTSLTTPAGSFTSGATSFTIPAHSLAYDYDDAGRKISETSDGRQVSYGYDGAGGQSGSRTRTVWPDGYRVSYVYDALNRMSTVWEGLPNTTQLADYRYDALQRRQRLQYANQANHRVDYSYEPDNNLDVLTHVLNTVQVTLDYAYNGSGQIAHFANAGH